MGLQKEVNLKNCNVCGHTLANCVCPTMNENIQKKTYSLPNLDCANCGLKIQEALKKYPAIKDCSVSYPLKQMNIEAADQADMYPEIVEIIKQVEPDVEIIPEDKQKVFFNICGLDCANCAKKVENHLKKDPTIIDASINYAGQTLMIDGIDPVAHINQYQKEIDSVEDGITLTLKRKDHPSKTNESKSEDNKNNIELIQILLGTAIFALSWFFESKLSPQLELIFQLFAYILLGGKVLVKAVKNILKGNWFDENFLMAVATIGAFILGDYHEGVGVMLFYRIGEFFEDYAVNKSRKQITDTINLKPESVNLIENNKIISIPAEDAQVGEIVMIRPGDRVPLDGVVTKGDSRIDTSPVTGEFVPVHVKTGDHLTSGTINKDSAIEMKVLKPLSESMVTKILDSVENAASNKPKIDRFITKFSKIYTPIVICIALFVAIVPSLITGNWHHWVYTAISFLVISCPCALVLSVPLAYFCGIGAASKLGILFKGGNTVEALNNVNTIALDKTGTITEGNFVVQKILPNKITADELIKIAASCEFSSTHPIGQSIISYAKEKKINFSQPESVKEIAGKGLEVNLNGKTYYCGNKKLLDMMGIKFNPQIVNYGTVVYLADKDEYLGEIVISDTVKSNAASIMKRLKKLGLKLVLLTGDTKENANAIGKKLGLDKIYASLLPDDKLQRMNDLRNEGADVMYIGDGINDSPVLAGANVGAAMGSGSDSAIEAADVVFNTSNLQAILDSYEIGKKTYRIAIENVIISLVVKAAILLIGLFGYANMWLAVFADTGVAMICILNSIRILYMFNKRKQING